MTRSDNANAGRSDHWLENARESGAFAVRHLVFRIALTDTPGTPALGSSSTQVVIPKGGWIDTWRIRQDVPGSADIDVDGTSITGLGLANGAAGTIYAVARAINAGDAISATNVDLDAAGSGLWANNHPVQATADLHADDLNIIGVVAANTVATGDAISLAGTATSSSAVIVDLWVRTPGEDPE